MKGLLISLAMVLMTSSSGAADNPQLKLGKLLVPAMCGNITAKDLSDMGWKMMSMSHIGKLATMLWVLPDGAVAYVFINSGSTQICAVIEEGMQWAKPGTEG